jgi:type II secretory pathway predicted ATPase ExeA
VSIDRLRAHYGFSRMPFGKELAPQSLFRSKGHAEAVARISWLISERGIGLVTGEVGAGKTVAARAATAALDRSRYTLVYLSDPSLGVRGLYAEIVRALGAVPRFLRAGLIPQAQELLATEETERAKKVVVIADEAHLMSPEQLESLRLLTNADMDSRAPLACLLLGQPTLRRRLRLGSFAALDQRIGLRYNIEGMDLAETASYVKHHLALAGRSDPLFSDDAIALIHQTARGIPRAVNNLALQSLVAAFLDGKGIVDESSARSGVAEVTSD